MIFSCQILIIMMIFSRQKYYILLGKPRKYNPRQRLPPFWCKIFTCHKTIFTCKYNMIVSAGSCVFHKHLDINCLFVLNYCSIWHKSKTRRDMTIFTCHKTIFTRKYNKIVSARSCIFHKHLGINCLFV